MERQFLATYADPLHTGFFCELFYFAGVPRSKAIQGDPSKMA